jgi:hypothetical protein
MIVAGVMRFSLLMPSDSPDQSEVAVQYFVFVQLNRRYLPDFELG